MVPLRVSVESHRDCLMQTIEESRKRGPRTVFWSTDPRILSLLPQIDLSPSRPPPPATAERCPRFSLLWVQDGRVRSLEDSSLDVALKKLHWSVAYASSNTDRLRHRALQGASKDRLILVQAFHQEVQEEEGRCSRVRRMIETTLKDAGEAGLKSTEFWGPPHAVARAWDVFTSYERVRLEAERVGRNVVYWTMDEAVLTIHGPCTSTTRRGLQRRAVALLLRGPDYVLLNGDEEVDVAHLRRLLLCDVPLPDACSLCGADASTVMTYNCSRCAEGSVCQTCVEARLVETLKASSFLASSTTTSSRTYRIDIKCPECGQEIDRAATTTPRTMGVGKERGDSREEKTKQCAWCGISAVPLSTCARCGEVAYCGKECQKRAWRTHKLSCCVQSFVSSRKVSLA